MRLSEENPDIRVEELSNEYAILNVPESAMDQVADAVEVEYVEKPKRMYFAVQVTFHFAQLSRFFHYMTRKLKCLPYIRPAQKNVS